MNEKKYNYNFDVEQFLNDGNSIYYEFEDGLIAKYDKDKSLFYRLDNGVWLFDNSILSLITDSKYDYTIIKETGGRIR